MLIPTAKETAAKIRHLLFGKSPNLSDSYIHGLNKERERILTLLESCDKAYTKKLLDSLGVTEDCYGNKPEARKWLRSIKTKIGYSACSIFGRFGEEVRIEDCYERAVLIYNYLIRSEKIHG